MTMIKGAEEDTRREQIPEPIRLKQTTKTLGGRVKSLYWQLIDYYHPRAIPNGSKSDLKQYNLKMVYQDLRDISRDIMPIAVFHHYQSGSTVIVLSGENNSLVEICGEDAERASVDITRFASTKGINLEEIPRGTWDWDWDSK